MPHVLRSHPDDNVATALENAAPGPVAILGESELKFIDSAEPVSRGHKLALAPISAGADVVKFGIAIGRATADIGSGDWVHTHNCASPLDSRSATLDRHTGAPTDTRYD